MSDNYHKEMNAWADVAEKLRREIAALRAWRDEDVTTLRDERDALKSENAALRDERDALTMQIATHVPAEQLAEARRENAELRARLDAAIDAMVNYHYRPRHSGSCCWGKDGFHEVTPETCQCTPDEKAYFAVLSAAVKESP